MAEERERKLFDYTFRDWQNTGAIWTTVGLIMCGFEYLIDRFPYFFLGMVGAGIVSILIGVRSEELEENR